MSCELVCVCVSLERVVIICLASIHTALVSSRETFLILSRAAGMSSSVATHSVGGRLQARAGRMTAVWNDSSDDESEMRRALERTTPTLRHSHVVRAATCLPEL